MSTETPPAWLQGSEQAAEQQRRAVYSAMLQRGASIGSVVGGLIGAGDMEITIGTGLHVKVSPGEAIVPGTTSATQSGYYSRNASSTELTLSAANETNPRVDRISAVLKDKAYAGTEEAFVIAVEPGTPTSGANLSNLSGVAAAPASSITLGYALIPAKATTPSEVSNVATRSPFNPTAAQLRFVGNTAGTTATEGECQFFNSGTVTLPSAPSVGALVEAYYYGATSGKVKAPSGTINGDFISLAGEITLTANQHVRLIWTGSAWYIVSGEPKWATAATARTERTVGVEYEPSPTRPTEVLIEFYPSGRLFVGGVERLDITGTAERCVSFICPAGVKWRVTEATSLYSSYQPL